MIPVARGGPAGQSRSRIPPLLAAALLWSAAADAGCSGGDADTTLTPDASVDCTGDGDCGTGELCVVGQCVAEVMDQDGDGISVRRDCDDEDPNVGVDEERTCSEPDCPEGVQTCEARTWGPCRCTGAAFELHGGLVPGSGRLTGGEFVLEGGLLPPARSPVLRGESFELVPSGSRSVRE